MTEVEFHRRLRGGGFGGGGKGFVVVGEAANFLGIGHAPNVGGRDAGPPGTHVTGVGHLVTEKGRMEHRGAKGIRFLVKGNSKGGLQQGGVSTGMGGLRGIGQNCRDQPYVPGREPSHRK